MTPDELHKRTVDGVVERYGSAHISSLTARSPGWLTSPTGVVVHVPGYAAGARTLDGWDLARRFLTRGARSSAHIIVSWPDGDLLMPVPLTDRAWHAGPANGEHVGIDVMSPGFLDPLPGTGWGISGKPVLLPTGKMLTKKHVLYFGGLPRLRWPYGRKWWHCPTPAQIVGLVEAIKLTRKVHPTIQQDRVVRHADLEPHRRSDPGPGVPLEWVREWAWRDDDPRGALPVLPSDDPQSGWDWQAWHDFLIGQWKQPSGVVLATDRRIAWRSFDHV